MASLFSRKAKGRDPASVTNEELGASWRSREAQLLKLLSAKNLDSIKGSFDMLTSDENPGLSGAQFMSTLLKLFGHLILDREEFAISGLELFNAIDVRAGLLVAVLGTAECCTAEIVVGCGMNAI